ncbi:MAG: carbohydrate binding domain-containing protein, partial [Cytophaga sp.]|uniref:carbohydrate binding domain-containing protein n=1 Tax=Cytophaga sp. TaxID=29535 RepID=UPI003F7E958A
MLKKIFTICTVYLAMHASYAQNLITNGSFEQTTNWTNLAGDGGSATYTFISTDAVDGTTSLKTDVTTLGSNAWSIQSIHSGWTATPGTPYTLSFYAKAAGTPTSLKSVMQSTNSNYYAEKTYALTTDWVKYEWTFTPTEAAEQLKFNYLTAGGVYYIDNVQVVDPAAGGPLTLTIDKSTSYQQMTGFGGALSWYCDRIISSPKKTEIADLLFSDLGTDIIRLKNWYYPAGYPAVKSPATMETDWFNPHFDATNQLYTMAKQENENIDVLLSSWGPPSALKSNDNLNEGTLKSSNGQFMYSEFGQYWT